MNIKEIEARADKYVAFCDKFETLAEDDLMHADITTLLAEVKRKDDALQDSLDTLMYVRQYVCDRGLSAEDDCDQSIKMATEALKGASNER